MIESAQDVPPSDGGQSERHSAMLPLSDSSDTCHPFLLLARSSHHICGGQRGVALGQYGTRRHCLATVSVTAT